MFSGADSFFKRGEFTVNQIYWDYTNVGMLTSAGDMVPNYEPAQMVAAIPFYLWGRALGAAVQGTLFLNPLVTALAVGPTGAGPWIRANSDSLPAPVQMFRDGAVGRQDDRILDAVGGYRM